MGPWQQHRLEENASQQPGKRFQQPSSTAGMSPMAAIPRRVPLCAAVIPAGLAKPRHRAVQIVQHGFKDLRLISRRVERGWMVRGCPGRGEEPPCRWHSYSVRGRRVPPGAARWDSLLNVVALSSWFLAGGKNFDASSCTAGFAALAKRGCFGEGPDCAGKERPCPAPAGLTI